MTRKGKCNWKSNSFVAAVEQVRLQPVLEHRQRRGRCNVAARMSDNTRSRAVSIDWSGRKPDCSIGSRPADFWAVNWLSTLCFPLVVNSIYGHKYIEPAHRPKFSVTSVGVILKQWRVVNPSQPPGKSNLEYQRIWRVWGEAPSSQWGPKAKRNHLCTTPHKLHNNIKHVKL